MTAGRIYWPQTRKHPSGRLGRVARSWRRSEPCESFITRAPDDPESDELGCDRPAGHGGRHYAWQWENDGEAIVPLPYIVAVWGEDVHAEKRHAATCPTICEHCGCCEHTPESYECEGRPGCVWNTCGCGVA